jgi:hypothetical protein
VEQGREKLDWIGEPIWVKTDLDSLLQLELLIGVFVVPDGSETLSNSPLEESLDNSPRSLEYSSFREWRRDSCTLDILEGWDKKSMEAAIRASISLNALYRLGGSTQLWPSLSQNLNCWMVPSTLPDFVNTSSLMQVEDRQNLKRACKHGHTLKHDRPLQSTIHEGRYDQKLEYMPYREKGMNSSTS